MLLLLAVPFAIFFECISAMALNGSRWLVPSLGLALLILFAFDKWYLWNLLAIMVLAFDYKRPRQWNLLLTCVLATIFGYATLWNVNYLVLHHFGKSLHDPALRIVDVAFYSLLSGTHVDYTNFFPMVREPTLLLIFNNAYGTLFGEIVLAIFLICQSGNARRAIRFLLFLFGLYATGVIVFMIYPVAGPFLYFPESISSAGSFLLSGMAKDYKVIMTGRGALTGFGYFVALPSLHVLVVIFLQTFLFRFKRLFVVFLPVNILLILSTVILGYHYAMDVAAALVIAALPCALFFRAETNSTGPI